MNHDLTDPAVNPPTQYLCRKRKAKTMGIIEMKAPEVTKFQTCSDAAPAWDFVCHWVNPTVIGNNFGLVRTT